MFHQANLRVVDVYDTMLNDIQKQRSLLQMWVETVVTEFNRLVNWPLITKTHDDLAITFNNRMTRDLCQPSLLWQVKQLGGSIVISGFELSAVGNYCAVPIPVTLPSGTVTSLLGSTTEQIGNDPLTLWVSLDGSAMSFDLTSPISLNGTPWLATGKVAGAGPVTFAGPQYSGSSLQMGNNIGQSWRFIVLVGVVVFLMN